MLSAASLEAVKTLVSLQEPSVPAAVRLGAARSILELGSKLREMVELEQRLLVVERRISQPNHDGEEKASRAIA
jgi:ribosomal protein S9